MSMPLSERQRQALAEAASASGYPSGSVTAEFHLSGRSVGDQLRRMGARRTGARPFGLATREKP